MRFFPHTVSNVPLLSPTADGGLLMHHCLGCRCEQTLFNAPGEALALTDAARLFLSSEKENRALQAPGFDEHLQAALNCYSFAIKVCK